MEMSPAIALISLAIIIFGLVAIVIGWRFANTAEMDDRMRVFVVDQEGYQLGWGQETKSAPRPELRGSFTSRTIAPFFRGSMRSLGRFTPSRTMADLNQQLTTAGNPYNLGAREFYGIRIIFLVLAGLLFYLFYTRIPDRGLIIGLLAFVTVAYLPSYWLKRKVRIRKTNIRRMLPDALDMLSVCADAGLGFDQSMQRVGESWPTDLGREFSKVVKEMGLGYSRAVAMRNMSNRLQVQELTSFVAVVLQSDELGMSIAETLHSQANQMRIERRYWAQEQARKLPIKMIFPLVFLIFPALFVVILGPAVPALAALFRGF